MCVSVRRSLVSVFGPDLIERLRRTTILIGACEGGASLSWTGVQMFEVLGFRLTIPEGPELPSIDPVHGSALSSSQAE